MIKKLVFILLISLSTNAFSQYYKTYNWNESVEYATLSDSEMQESSLGLLKKTIIEYSPALFGDNTNMFETQHTITYVNDEKGISRHNTVYIPMYGVEDVLDIKARTINKDGKVTLLNKDNIKEVNNVEEYGDFKIFAIEGAEKQSIIEVLYTVKKEYDMQGDQTIQSDYPIKHAEFKFITGELNNKIKAYRTNETFVTTETGAQVLKIDNIPAMLEEEYATPDANRIEVVYQCFPKGQKITQEMFWNNVVNNVGSRFFVDAVETQVMTEIKTLLEGKDVEKLNLFQTANLVDDYIKSNYAVIKNNNPELSQLDYILKNKIASDYGILQVYSQFLTALKINFEVVITANRFQHKFDPDFFNPGGLRDFLIFLPEEEKYIAPDRIEYRVGEAPFNLLGNYGLYINNDYGYYFSKIIQHQEDYSKINRVTDISFDEDMTQVVIKQNQEYSGHWAVTNRAVLALSPEDSIKEFEDYITGSGIEDKVTESFESSNTDMLQMEYNVPYTVKATITSESLLEEAGESYIFNIGKVIGTQSELYQETERVNPIEMQYPNQYDYNMTITIPDGYTVEGLESLQIFKEYKDVNGKQTAKFESDYELKDNKIIITIQEFYKTNEFDLHKYEEFRTVINAASDFNKAAILLNPVE